MNGPHHGKLSDVLAKGRARCLVLHPHLRGRNTRRRTPDACLDEAVGLAAAIDLVVVASGVVNVNTPRPATLIGKGAVDEWMGRLGPEDDDDRIGLVVVDATLTPIQQRNLERAWKAKVIDRTGLILEIFGARARTREGALQVELAALSYQRSRLVRSWTHLERQRGGFGFLGGPGETQIETDRRLIDERIVRIKKELEDVTRTRGLHRQARRRVPYPIVALVGYTNAGKSTLFNTLTEAEVVARDQLFATLDPTMRRLKLPSGRMAILSDTVGFVSDLPHELVAAFRATLEEVREADLVLHVRDAAHPDTAAQEQDVRDVLKELGIDASASHLIEGLNKIDLLDDETRTQLAARAGRETPPAYPISAVSGAGCAQLLAEIDRRLGEGRVTIEASLDPADGARLAWLYRHGEVIERQDSDDAIRLKVRLDPEDVGRFEGMKG